MNIVMHVLDVMDVLMITIVLLIVMVGVHVVMHVLGVHLDFLVPAHYVMGVLMAVLVVTVMIHAIVINQSLYILEVRPVMGQLRIAQQPLHTVQLATLAVVVMHATEYVQVVLAVMFVMTDVILMIKLVLYKLLLF